MRSRRSPHGSGHCGFIPPYLLRNVADSGSECARQTLVTDEGLRLGREVESVRPPSPVADGWVVHTADNDTSLPGRPVRRRGEPAVGDESVDEAAAGIEATLAMFRDGLGRDSYDGAGVGVSLTVHYGRDYANAFWDGTQLVFGDGDPELFERFTKPVDVLAHEFSHAVVEHTTGFAYRGQSGALNESVADVFASCLKQRLLGQEAGAGDWLIGEGIFRPGVRARALRDMAAPGTAYDDPRLGRDPQVGHMDDYVETSDDNGGVHLNSGIPNRAFHLAATAIGGESLAGAGAIWYAALTAGTLRPDADFAAFAAATVASAGEHAGAVAAAWSQVGIAVGSSAGSAGGSGGSAGSAPAAAGTVRVSRSGGFAGITQHFEVDLDSPGPGVADVRAALDRVIDERALVAPGRAGVPMPDHFDYTFQVGGSAPVHVAEQDLTDSLRGLADAVRNCRRGDR